MKTKLEMAHEYAINHMMNPQYKNADDLDVISWAWDYADAMQAEADKRKPSEFPNVLRGACGEIVAVRVDDKEWQPDWSQAPEWANWWAMDMDKNCYWYEDKLHLGDVEWDRHSIGKSFKSKHYGYTGDWRNSLRKRPK